MTEHSVTRWTTGRTLSTLRPGIGAAPPRVGVIMAGGEEDESGAIDVTLGAFDRSR
jgi:hypothetical protein